LIDWYLKPTLAIFQLYRGVKKITINLNTQCDKKMNLS